jgi:signal transduction histidine kinase
VTEWFLFDADGHLMSPDPAGVVQAAASAHASGISMPEWTRARRRLEAAAAGGREPAAADIEALLGVSTSTTQQAAASLIVARTFAAAGKPDHAEQYAGRISGCCPDARDELSLAIPLYAVWLRAGLNATRIGLGKSAGFAAEIQSLVAGGHIGTAEDLATLRLIAERTRESSLDSVIADLVRVRDRFATLSARAQLAARWVGSAERPSDSGQLIMRTLDSPESQAPAARVLLPDGRDVVAVLDPSYLASWISDRASRGRFEMSLRMADGASSAAPGVFPLPLVEGAKVATLLVRHRDGSLAESREGLFTAALAVTVLLALALGYLATRDVSRELRLAATRTAFVAGVTHEMKTPLASIRLIAETLRQERARPEVRDELLETVVDETDRLARLVDNVLSSSRIESGTRKYATQLVPLAASVRDAIARLDPMLRRDGFRVRTTIDDPALAVMADPEALGQSIVNLLGNAAKYSDSSREIRVSIGRRAGTAAIVVEDDGIGIDRAEQSRVFDPFYRGSTAAEQTTGAGLGLWLVRHFAAAHGGHVSVTSTPGKGSTFILELPLHQPVP